MKTLFTSVLLLLLWFYASAQQRVNGYVTDDKGQPLNGATAFISESKVGTTTDSLGNFSITIGTSGVVQLVVSYIGYETQVKAITPGNALLSITFALKPVSNQLQEVIVSSQSKDSWKKWGSAFIEAFIGASPFAAHCTIANTKVIGFDHNNDKQTLHAYANDLIIIKNEDLGYIVTIGLVDFTLYIANNDVDYRAYYFFEDMKGDSEQQALWDQNRRKAYALSFMHFTRALYDDKLKEEGFEMRQFMPRSIKEQKRIKTIYSVWRAHYQDSLKNRSISTKEINKLIDGRFNKDTLRYYKMALSNDDISISEPLNAADVIKKQTGKLAALYFSNNLQVSYKKTKEPEEYYKFRTQIEALNAEGGVLKLGSIVTNQPSPRDNPKTDMRLTQNQPVEVAENGKVNNTNLYLQGFWGWWEKVATKLPYEYYPD